MTASSPLVSVILAAHDAERFLPLAVESVLLQTVADLELVVVDDASTDATPELLSRIDDSRLVVLRNGERLGLAASLNHALEHARGRYVARLDADDVAFPRRLERQLARIGSSPRVVVLGGAALELDERGRLGAFHAMPTGADAVRWHALFASPFLHPSVLIDREVLEKHGLRYDPEFLESEDYDLWTRLLALEEGDNLREPLILYRAHESQASRRRRDVQRDFQLRVALREIARIAPTLSSDRAELAWRVGAAESIDPARIEDAADAYLALVGAFEGTGRGGIRETAARSLARAAAGAPSTTGSRILAQALRLDPALPARVVARRARNVADGRAARRRAESWLAQLGSPGISAGLTSIPPSGIRVVAVFPEPTPYRAPLLDRVAALPEIDLTVLYAARTVAGRTWHVDPHHRAVYLSGVRLPGAGLVLHHDYPLTPGVARALERARPDVVVVSGWSTFASQGAIAWCRLRRVPYVLVVESHDEGPRPGWRRSIKRTFVPPIVRNSAGTLVTGTLARRSMIERGASPERVRVFANTIDVEGFGERADRLAARRPELREALGASQDDVVVLSVARLASEKGHDVLIRAVAAAEDPRLVLVLAGSGPERERLESLGRELGVRLFLAGDTPWDRIVEVYAAADVFALLSEREPWAVVVNEAAACGLPLVLSDRVGAAHDLLQDGKNGFLVPVGDVAAAAAALGRLAADPDARRRAGARSREAVRSWGYGPSVESFRVAVHEATTAPDSVPASIVNGSDAVSS